MGHREQLIVCRFLTSLMIVLLPSLLEKRITGQSACIGFPSEYVYASYSPLYSCASLFDNQFLFSHSFRASDIHPSRVQGASVSHESAGLSV